MTTKVMQEIPTQMTIKLEDGGLACPNCGHDWGLHHRTVAVYGRDGGDGNINVVRVRGPLATSATIRRDDVENPSPHTSEGGINIELECDNCWTKGMLLTIWQHKGGLMLSTRRIKPE